ncbi:TRAP transporter small permease subunit [Blastococcus mobilis]|uniref:TRAP-type C4-dicarboxylate transport system, small permease component n=1 Tax=Blastococcus mobilis TaxID=1938746 RepID=A0A238ZEA3_9ACTN|nr:TRAP transporter small permease [Blastococcus mobilis]SNR81083.1 TRAP-type C4-dicarboxylate transport system, small permease component [Blastococcus mobilis]
MKKLDDLVGKVSALLAVLAAVCTLAMMFTMIADVGNRLVGNGSLAGAYELAAMLLVIVVFLGFAYAERTETNVRVTLGTSRMPHAVARVVRLVGGVVSTVVVAVFAKATWEQAMVSMERGEFTQGIVDFPVWPTKLIIAVGFSFLTLECLLGLWRRWTSRPAVEGRMERPAEAHL